MITLYLTDWDCFVIRRAMCLNAKYYMMHEDIRKKEMISAYNDVCERKMPIRWKTTVVRMIRNYIYRMKDNDKYRNYSFKTSPYDPYYYNPVINKLTISYKQYNKDLLDRNE